MFSSSLNLLKEKDLNAFKLFYKIKKLKLSESFTKFKKLLFYFRNI